MSETYTPEEQAWLDARGTLTDAQVYAALAPIMAARAADDLDRQDVRNAYQANKAFLAIASPTTGEAVAQVKALTRQVNGLVRLLVERLD